MSNNQVVIETLTVKRDFLIGKRDELIAQYNSQIAEIEDALDVLAGPLTNYQLEKLKGYFSLCSVVKLGLIDETGDLIIEFYPVLGGDGGLHTIKITRQKEISADETEFEIIQPKLLK